MAELSDEEVSRPQELTDAQVSGPAPLDLSQTFASADYIQKYKAEQLKQLAHPGPGLFAGLPALTKWLGAGVASIPGSVVDGIADLLGKSHKAWSEGLTPQEEVEFGVNTSLATIGGGEEFRMPKTKAPSVAEQFHEQVTKPAVEAMVGTPPDQIEPPMRIVVPLDPRNATAAFPPPGVPRSQLALTGEPHIDTVVNSTKNAIDNAVVDRTQDVPNGIRTESGVTFIDRNLPRAIQADGKVFDPADPLIVRENVTRKTVQVLRDGGMGEEAANRVALDAGSKAETAWYEAHGIYEKPDIAPVKVEEPSDKEFVRAENIIDKADLKPEVPPAPQANPLMEAHDLGVVGGPKPEVPEDSPAVAAQRAIPAGARQGDKITMTPAGEPISAWEARFNDWVDRLQTPDDVKPFIIDAAAHNSNFADARAGEVNPAHVEILADAAGIDPAEIERGPFKKIFDTDTKVRMAKEAMDQALNKYKEAGTKYGADPTAENAAEMLSAKIRRDYIIEQLLGLRAEWGRTGRALKDLLEARGKDTPLLKEEELRETLGKKKPETPKNVEDVIDSVTEFMQNATKGEAKLGLDKLVAAAEKLVDETAPKEVKPGEPKLELDPDVKELVKTAQAVVNLMKPKEAREPPAATVRPLRKIEGLGEPGAKPSPLAAMNKLISEAERNVTEGIKEGKPVMDAMPKALADMVAAAENTTSHFGGIGLQKAIDSLLARKGMTMGDLQAEARSIRGLSNAQVAKLLTDMRGKAQPWYYWMYQQSLISGEITHSRYVVSNYGFSTMDRTAAPALAAVISKLRGGERTFFGEPVVGAMSLLRATPDALRASLAAFRSGLRVPLPEEMQLADRALSRGERIPRDLLHTAAIPYGQPGAPDWGAWQRILNDKQLEAATTTVGIPGRMASAIHAYFKTLNVMASRSARAYHEAAKEVSDPWSKEFKDRYDYHYANPTDEAMRGAVQDGYNGTFMARLEPWQENLAQAVRGSPLKWLFPFMHVPVNIAMQTVRYSPIAGMPLGKFNKVMRDDLMGRNGETAQNLAISKAFIGSAIMGYFIWKGLEGTATGDYPIHKQERDEWRLMGKIPNATQFMGSWYQMQRFGPAGNLAMLGADIGAIIRHDTGKQDSTVAQEMFDILGHSVLAAISLIGNEVGFMSLQNLYDVMDGKQSMAKYVAQQAGSFIPFSSFLYQTAGVLDPNMREAKGLIDSLKMRVPFLRNTLMPKRDPLYGEPIVNPGYMSIFRHVPVQDADPVKRELERINYFPTAPKPEIGGIKLTPEQYDRYEATAGPNAKKALTELMESPIWKMHNNQPDWQKTMAQSRVSEARAQAARTVQIESVLRDGPDNLIAQGRARRLKLNGSTK